MKPTTHNLQLTTNNMPKHIGIVMDGNRRWAKKRKIAILMGHRTATFETIEKLVDRAIEMGVSYLTLWAFSTENWNRDRKEVEGLLSLFREALSDSMERFHKRGVRVCAIGDLSKFPDDIQKKITNGIEQTKKNKNLTLTFALNYGGRDEILRGINKFRNSKLEIKNLTTEVFSQFLDTAGMPDPDLIIRTGGEKRLSGFLPWQLVYSELYFTDVLFPDFTPEEFEKAILDYQSRQRRFGQ